MYDKKQLEIIDEEKQQQQTRIQESYKCWYDRLVSPPLCLSTLGPPGPICGRWLVGTMSWLVVLKLFMGFLWLCWNKCSVYAEIHKLRWIYCIIPYAITHRQTDRQIHILAPAPANDINCHRHQRKRQQLRHQQR